MTKMICLPVFIVTLLLLSFGAARCEDAVSLTDESPLKLREYQGHASIRVQESRIAPAAKLRLCVEFVNEGNDHRFYNPFFRGVIPQCAELAVFDANKRFVVDLLLRGSGSFADPGNEAWVFIPHGCYVGTSLELEPRLPGLGGPENSLPPGRYFLQMIFHSRFASETPFHGLGTKESWRQIVRAWQKDFAKGDLFRSNVVEIELLSDKPGVEQPISAP